MDQPSLIGSLRKIERARHHFRTLQEDVLRVVYEDDMYEEAVEPDPQGGWDHGFNWVEMKGSEIFTYWGVLIGEIVHQLRSALGHLVWQLVLLNDETPNRSNEFPIVTTEDKWNAESPSKLRGVKKPHRAFIRAAQPYHRGDEAEGHPLYVLDDLAQTDKHRHVPVSFAAVSPSSGPGAIMFLADRPPKIGSTINLSTVERETDAYLSATPHLKSKVKMEREYAIDVQVGNGISFPGFIREAGIAVTGMLYAFERQFRA